MRTIILIFGNPNGIYTLRNAITSGSVICSVENSRYKGNGFMVYFNSKSDAKKALLNAKAYLIEQGNKAATAKSSGDFSYLPGQFINYDKSSAIIG
jgi:hypothetical protein